MGAFAETFGIKPWEMELLTLRQFEVLKRYLQQRNAELQKAAGS